MIRYNRVLEYIGGLIRLISDNMNVPETSYLGSLLGAKNEEEIERIAMWCNSGKFFFFFFILHKRVCVADPCFAIVVCYVAYIITANPN